jgi:anti-sigma-K factor RskA
MDGIERPDVHTLIGTYALDALDDDERAAFEQHLTECEPCREEVAGLRRTAVRLADAEAVVPPPRMRRQVLQRIGATPQVRDAPGTPHRWGSGSARPRSRGWLAAAAVLAVISVGLGGLAWSQYRAAEDARRTTQAITRILADPNARSVSRSLPGGASAKLVVADGRGVLAGDALPALADDRTYQVWIIRGPRISSAGLGPSGPDAAGSWSRLVDGVQPGDVVAVSVEPSGGSAQPTTPPVVTLAA